MYAFKQVLKLLAVLFPGINSVFEDERVLIKMR